VVGDSKFVVAVPKMGTSYSGDRLTRNERKAPRSSSDARLTIDEARQKMQKAIDFFSDQLHGITALGATPSLVETVRVSVYDQKIPVKHLAFTTSQGSRVTVTPHDSNTRSAIAKACQDAGFDAYVFSREAVVVNLPKPSGETKDEIRKRIKRLGDEAKVAIRNIRKQFKKGVPKDEKHEEEKRIQKVTDEAVGIVDQIVERKQAYVK